MKKYSKVMAILLVLCFSVLMLAGCGTKTVETATASPVPTATLAPTATPVPKVITMGTNAAFPPFEYLEVVNGQSTVVGVDADIATEIAKRLGYQLKIEDMDFDSLITALTTNKIDFIAAGMSVTPEREKQVMFSDNYFKASQTVIVKTASTIATKADLIGKKVAVQKGTTGDMDAAEIKDVQLSEFANGAEAVLALNNGSVDAVIIDNFPATKYVQNNTGLKAVTGLYDDESYAMAFRKTDTDFYNLFNAELKKMIADGTIAQYVVNRS